MTILRREAAARRRTRKGMAAITDELLDELPDPTSAATSQKDIIPPCAG
jgi:hypothetical protein